MTKMAWTSGGGTRSSGSEYILKVDIIGLPMWGLQGRKIKDNCKAFGPSYWKNGVVIT